MVDKLSKLAMEDEEGLLIWEEFLESKVENQGFFYFLC